MIFLPLFKGFLMGGSLIVAIGSQNAFALKQGIKRHHLFATAITCAFCDALLIITGVLGIGLLLDEYLVLQAVLRWGGFAFLMAYGIRSLFNATKPHALIAKLDKPLSASLLSTILIASAFSLLNPHAYIDTFLLLGSIGAQYPFEEQLPFLFGAVGASFVWFFALTYMAAKLTPVFKNPRAWQIMEILIGITMIGIGVSLIV